MPYDDDSKPGAADFASASQRDDLTRAEVVIQKQLVRLAAERRAAEERRAEVEALNERLRQQTIEREMQSREAQALTRELEEQAAELEAANLELAQSLREAEEAREAARRAEAEIRDQADVLRAVIDESPLVKIVMDLDLRVTRWNPAAERVFGWSAEEMVGRSYSVVIPEEMW